MSNSASSIDKISPSEELKPSSDFFTGNDKEVGLGEAHSIADSDEQELAKLGYHQVRSPSSLSLRFSPTPNYPIAHF